MGRIIKITALILALFTTTLWAKENKKGDDEKSELELLNEEIEASDKRLYELSQSQSHFAQNGSATLTLRQQRYAKRKSRKDSLRATKKVWLTVLGGPSYTPEASFGVAAAALATFRINPKDTISQRSFFPVGFNISLNGTYVVAGSGSLFFNENRFRIYTNYGYRREPANYFGKGIKQVDEVTKEGYNVTFDKEQIQFNPRFVWLIKNNFYLGAQLDINHTNSWNFTETMQTDSYINSFKSRYTNIGVGAMIQYDTRDDIATPFKGVYLSATPKVYGKYLGGSYNYEILDLEYRHFQPLFNRATLAWVARSQLSYGDVPFTELPTFGTPFDLRGYFLGQYRDKTMAYGIVEFRHMFGTWEDFKRGSLLSKFGYVVWAGTGTLGETPANWNRWKFNYGGGIRVQIQPGKNFRLDVGKGYKTNDMMVYFNMTEAF